MLFAGFPNGSFASEYPSKGPIASIGLSAVKRLAAHCGFDKCVGWLRHGKAAAEWLRATAAGIPRRTCPGILQTFGCKLPIARPELPQGRPVPRSRGASCHNVTENAGVSKAQSDARYLSALPLFPPAFLPFPAVMMVPVSTPMAKKARYMRAAGCLMLPAIRGGRVKST